MCPRGARHRTGVSGTPLQSSGLASSRARQRRRSLSTGPCAAAGGTEASSAALRGKWGVTETGGNGGRWGFPQGTEQRGVGDSGDTGGMWMLGCHPKDGGHQEGAMRGVGDTRGTSGFSPQRTRDTHRQHKGGLGTAGTPGGCGHWGFAQRMVDTGGEQRGTLGTPGDDEGHEGFLPKHGRLGSSAGQ